MIAFDALILFLPALVCGLSPVIVGEKWTGVRVVIFRTEIKIAFFRNTVDSTHCGKISTKENL